MKRQVIRWSALCVVLLMAIFAVAQDREEFLDIESVHVKPEKRAEFDALTKKMTEANRRNHGDSWLTIETMYGEGNVVTFISTRSGYDGVEKGMNAFMGALNKAFGEEQAGKMMGDWSSCVASLHTQLRRRRWDLSSNAPKDAAAYAKMVGGSRYLRTTRVAVRSGRSEDFEAMVREVKAAREKAAPQNVMLVSQVVAGEVGNVYYITTLEPTLGDYDKLTPIQKFLSAEDYQKWLKSNSEIVETAYTTIHRFLPDVSNPSAEIAAVSPDFWNPKPVVAAKKPVVKKQPKAEGQ
jgi:hypothetical protein